MSEDAPVQKCDFCRHRIPLEPVEMAHEGRTYVFCSRACRDALTEGEYVFSEYPGARQVAPGVSGLDRKLPQGMPRNAFVLLSAMVGAREGAVGRELLWRALRRDEPAVVVSFKEPPGALVQGFLELDWNVLPYLERGDLRIVDCFTYRVEDRDRMFDRMNRWNSHLYRVADDATESVRDASDLREVFNHVDNCLEALSMSDRGVVVLDSLTELGSLVQPVQAYDFVKDVRAHVCKGRYVPVFSGATFEGDREEFPHDLAYVADGVVDMELNADVVPDTLIKRLRIRKMSDVLSYSEWTAYEYTSGLGMVTFDPREELAGDDDGQPGDGQQGGGPQSAGQPGGGQPGGGRQGGQSGGGPQGGSQPGGGQREDERSGGDESGGG